MNTDPVTESVATRRTVRSAERDGVATKVVVGSRTYPTDQADLWDAVTNPERLPRWFAPVTGDLQAGGRFQVEGNAGGVIESCVEPETFAATWEFGGSTSWLTVQLTAVADGTTLKIAHESPVGAPLYASFWEQYGPGATGIGWDLALLFLARHVATGESFGPDAEAAFSASAEGRSFIAAAAESWGDAAIADGDDPDEARTAASNSAEFFTPPDDP